MTDPNLVQGLRNIADVYGHYTGSELADCARQAADEIEKLRAIYHCANDVMVTLGLEGEIHTRLPVVDALMGALWEYDNGVPVPKETSSDE